MLALTMTLSHQIWTGSHTDLAPHRADLDISPNDGQYHWWRLYGSRGPHTALAPHRADIDTVVDDARMRMDGFS